MKTRRQRRERKLRRWSDADWAELPDFLRLKPILRLSARRTMPDPAETLAKQAEITSDPDKRNELILKWLDKAEKNPDFGVQFDRHLGMLTESEEAEKHLWDNWLFQVATLGLLVVGAIVAIVALYP